MKRFPVKNCIYCDPYQVNSMHLGERLINFIPFYGLQYFSSLAEYYFKKRFPRSHAYITKTILKFFLKLLIFSRALQEIEILDTNEDLHNRILLIVQAARLKNIKIKSLKIFGKFKTNFFTAITKNKKIIFEGLPPLKIGSVSSIDFDNKSILKQLLKENGLPYAEGNIFWNKKTAINYAKKLGFPLVVKPASGSLSKHTFCDIKDINELIRAINITKIISRDFILEKSISGNVYRITIINNQIIACCLREPPNIIGDGTHTIEELINIKNSDPIRGHENQKNFTLHKIIINRNTLNLLTQNNLTSKSVPPLGKKIYLQNKIILAYGADIHDKTEEIHNENKKIFIKLSNLINAPILGIDFICEDISKSYRGQSCAIIETNSMPYIDMHHFPVSGKSRNVAGYIVENFLL